MPRFVLNDGTLVPGRKWSDNDRMVDEDKDPNTYPIFGDSVANRDKNFPLVGVRSYITEPAPQILCSKYPDGNMDEFVLKGYESCALQFSKKQYEQSSSSDIITGAKQIALYVNHPTLMLSWVEVCKTVGDLSCKTIVLTLGTDYTSFLNPEE